MWRHPIGATPRAASTCADVLRLLSERCCMPMRVRAYALTCRCPQRGGTAHSGTGVLPVSRSFRSYRFLPIQAPLLPHTLDALLRGRNRPRVRHHHSRESLLTPPRANSRLRLLVRLSLLALGLNPCASLDLQWRLPVFRISVRRGSSCTLALRQHVPGTPVCRVEQPNSRRVQFELRLAH
eukprot:scaffold1595_cov119-Isochrysis_galbana.AAC.1